MGARLFACESVLQRMERDGFHCCWRWRRKPRAPSTLTLEKPTEPHSTHQSPPPPPTRRAHLQPQLPSFPRCLPTLARKVFPGPLRLGPRGTGKRGAGPIAGGACYVMARRSPDWTAPRRRHLESQSPFLATTKSASRAWMRCSNGPTSSPPNPKAASPRGGRCQVPSTSPVPPSVVASHRGRHPALHRGQSQHGYLATGRPPRRALSVSTAERRGLSQFMQYLPQIPPAISPSSPPLPSSSRGAVQSARALVRNPPFFFLVQQVVHLHLTASLCRSDRPPRSRLLSTAPRLHGSPTSFSCANGGLDAFAQTDGQAASLVDPPRDTSLSRCHRTDNRQDDLSPPTSAARLRCVFANSPAPRRQVKKYIPWPQGRSIATWTASLPPPWVRVPPKRAPLAESYQRAQPARRHIDRPLQPYQDPRPHLL